MARKVYIELGEYFRKKRVILDYSQEEVARKIGEKRATYGSWEIGRSEMPLPIVKKLCKLYGVDFIELLREMEKHLDE